MKIDPREIGHPSGCVLWVCDPQNYENLLPVGATGELYIEGPNIGSGYVDDPVRTAAAFLEPPRWLQELRRCSCPQVYKTGDLVRFFSFGGDSITAMLVVAEARACWWCSGSLMRSGMGFL
jgi:non-ribosomal peptide synthetase component F